VTKGKKLRQKGKKFERNPGLKRQGILLADTDGLAWKKKVQRGRSWYVHEETLNRHRDHGRQGKSSIRHPKERRGEEEKSCRGFWRGEWQKVGGPKRECGGGVGEGRPEHAAEKST